MSMNDPPLVKPSLLALLPPNQFSKIETGISLIVSPKLLQEKLTTSSAWNGKASSIFLLGGNFWRMTTLHSSVKAIISNTQCFYFVDKISLKNFV